MKRLLALACAALAAIFAMRQPAPQPAISAMSPAPPPHLLQHVHRRLRPADSSPDALVYVVGAVVKPGLYRVRAEARVNDAVQDAGGLRADADPASVNLAEHVADGEEIHVLRAGENAAPGRSRRRTPKRKARARPGRAIDLNTAGERDLSAIPGIGATLAARIVEYRNVNGPFASLDELADVAGMTQRRIDAMAGYVVVGGRMSR